jgi:hypothetical protein
MELQFRQPQSDEQWDEYILKLPNYSLLLSSAKFDYLKNNFKDTFRFILFKNDKFVGVLEGFLDRIKIFGNYIECKHNPLLIQDLTDPEKEEILRESFVKLKEIAIRNDCLFIRTSPLISYDEIYNKIYLEFNAKQSPVHPQDALISQYFDISKSEEELRHDMSGSTRNNINKLLKNEDISVKIFNDMSVFNVFEDFYKQTKDFKGYRGTSIQNLKEEFEYQNEKGMLYFVVGYYKNKPISVWQNTKFGKYMHVYQAGSDIQFRQKNIRITYLLFWETVELCKQLGVEVLDLFGGMLPPNFPKDKKNPWRGIDGFKTSLGGTKMTYMHPRDIPIKSYYGIYSPYAKFRVKIKGHTVDW